MVAQQAETTMAENKERATMEISENEQVKGGWQERNTERK